MSEAGADEARAAKAALRRDLLARRAALSPRVRAAESASVGAALLDMVEIVRARGVFCCLSFGDELDTRPIVERLLERGYRVYVPRVERGETTMHIHPFPCALETRRFGLSQPRAGEPELAPGAIDEAIDVALVAGVGFDRRGFRLGYGAGYFDRFLAGRKFPALGLAFDAQLVDALPVEPHDVPMHAIVTAAARFESPQHLPK